MVTVTFLTVGTLKEKYLSDALAEYLKRLSAYAKTEVVELREEKIRNEDDEKEIASALEAEGDKILAAVPKDAYCVALCVEGEMPDSPALAKRIGAAIDGGNGRLVFVIGSSHGLSPRVKAAADVRLSVSRLTFPHQLMRVILAEAVYRAFTILNGKKYHK